MSRRDSPLRRSTTEPGLIGRPDYCGHGGSTTHGVPSSVSWSDGPYCVPQGTGGAEAPVVGHPPGNDRRGARSWMAGIAGSAGAVRGVGVRARSSRT